MQLRPYQVDAVRFLAVRGRSLLALPPGAGKTAIVSSVLANDRTPGLAVLIVCPTGPVMFHWRDEIEEWGGGHQAAVGTGPKERRAATRQRAVETGTFLILGYETFRQDAAALTAIEWDCVVFDESHRLKNRQSQVFKAAKKLHTDRLILVSGTPVLNRAEELWTSLHLMYPEKFRSFWKWADAFFTISYPRYRQRIVREVGAIKSPEHAKLMSEDLAKRMFYRPLSEILPDLPPVTETYYEVVLSADEQKAHDSMMDNFWMEVGDDIVQAPNHISRLTALRRLASDWSAWGEPPGTKCQVAAQLVDELDGEPCVVFVAFRATAEAAASIMPNAAYYHGGMTAAERARTLESFRSSGITTLVATIATLGEGVDGLQHVAHNVIFLDRDWTPARNDQAIARLRRSGQADSVNVIHIVATDTTDDVVNQALVAKRDVVDAVIHQGRKA